MPNLPIDADNHYYEPLDAFTRHLDKAYRDRGVKVVQEGKRTSGVGSTASFPTRPSIRSSYRAVSTRSSAGRFPKASISGL
jgi:hypothetical protein